MLNTASGSLFLKCVRQQRIFTSSGFHFSGRFLLLALVLLTLAAVSFPQALHPDLAGFSVASKERLQAIGLHDCTQFDVVLALDAVFASGIAIRDSNKYGCGCCRLEFFGCCFLGVC